MYNLHRILLTVIITLGAREALFSQAPKIEFQTAITSTVSAPTYMATAKDGSGRLFVLEQGGRILVVPKLGAPATVFLDLTSKVISGGERGLLGLVFHPDFASNHRFFVDYTRKSDGTVTVAEYRTSDTNPNVADVRESVVLSIPHPNTDHNGGSLQFGPDGYLYISVGDGGVQKDPSANAQNLQLFYGKILRIDVDHPSSSAPYSIPPDNPFVGSAIARPEIYAYGFRNPWRTSFDELTGQLYVGDVGNDSFEEVDLVEAGGNYGWPVMEALTCTGYVPGCGNPAFIPPITQYVHTGKGGRCSISGGYVYRGSKETFPLGAYLFGDYCTGEVMMLYEGTITVLSDTAAGITAFGEDDDGEIYMVGGNAYRMVNTGSEFLPTVPFEWEPDDSGVSLQTQGSSQDLSIVHAQIQLDDPDTTVGAIAFIDFRQKGILVSEASMPATALIERGRIGAEMGAAVATGLAIANPDMIEAAALKLTFTDVNGNDVASSDVTIAAGGQIAAFLDQVPFKGPPAFLGSLTIESSVPISITALKGLINERAEFLTTTLPVADLDADYSAPVVIPHFAAGAGWTSQVTLVNPTDQPLAGVLAVLASAGTPEDVSTDGVIGSNFAYTIPAHGARQMNIAAVGQGLSVGSIRINPQDGMDSPSVGTVYRYAPAGITVSATGASTPASATQFTLYAEGGDSVQTGLAIANPSSEEILVDLHFTPRDGNAAEITQSVTIPANGQRVAFLADLFAFDESTKEVPGIMTVSSATPVSVLSLRTQYNERGDFLMSTITPETRDSAAHESFFPQLVDGAGYTTEIVVFPMDSDESNSGDIHFFTQGGVAVIPSFRPN